FLSVLGTVDVVLLPVSPILTPTWDRVSESIKPGPNSVGRFTSLVNVVGAPSLTFPCGFSSTGIPMGVQLVGGLHAAYLLLRIGYAYQKRTDWHSRRPL